MSGHQRGWQAEAQPLDSSNPIPLDTADTLTLPAIGSPGVIEDQPVRIVVKRHADSDEPCGPRQKRQRLVSEVIDGERLDAAGFFGKVHDRFEKCEVHVPRFEVRFENLSAEASVNIGTRALPNVLKAYWQFLEGSLQSLHLWPGKQAKFTILDHVSGVLCPGRLTLLLGPPGGGKTTLLKALAGKSDANLKVQGRVTYNGESLDDFTPQRASCYIDQYDTHLAQLTVRETLDFSARCYGVESKAELLRLVREREGARGIIPESLIDDFMSQEVKANEKESIVTELYLRLLGLEVCADTLIGSQMVRGISGGQKKRVTTGEMVVAPCKVLLMDEISTGLDSSTAFQIVRALRDFAKCQEATVMISLLQPAEETYNLFDDVMLLSDGHVVFFGPAPEVMPFFNSLGFALPSRKGVPDFLQEVTSQKEQQQYWVGPGKHRFTPVAKMAEAYWDNRNGQAVQARLAQPLVPSDAPDRALPKATYALSGLDAFRACFWRELILSKREMFVYKFKTFQIAVTGFIAGTLFLRTHLHPRNAAEALLYQGALFYTLLVMLQNGLSEMAFTIERLPVFWKHRSNRLYPSWAYILPTMMLRLPFSFVEGVVWTAFTYWVIGFAPTASRFFIFFLFSFLMHYWSVTTFCLIGACCRDAVVANSLGAGVLLLVLLTSGFTIAKGSLHPWWVWFAWCNPMFYAQRGLVVNEFLAPRWQTKPYPPNPSMTLGNAALTQRSFPTEQMWVWIGVGCLIGFSILFIILNMLAHAYLAGKGRTAANVSRAFLEEREAAIHGDGSDKPKRQSGEHAALSKGLSMEPLAGTSQEDSDTFPYLGAVRPETTSARQLNADGRIIDGRPESQSRISGSSRRLGGVATGLDTSTHHGSSSSRVSLGGDKEDNSLHEPSSSRRLPGVSGTSLSSSRREVAIGEEASGGDSGMVLPFVPSVVTFQDIHYFVEVPKEARETPGVKMEDGKPMLEILKGISGAFRPGILTSLMGVSGAGKTTLMDVLASRKTGGKITGEIKVDGHPMVASTFARISGYVEQFDIHSPNTTVHEALLFSARCRLSNEHSNKTVAAFSQEVMGLVELGILAESLVGSPGVNGLSTEQRKRLTIAVELVANPSIVFMDEPTSGLDARAAAVVMRTVRNIVNTGRTIVCTIHQPSINIFEAFDELLLLKRGGTTTYYGNLGPESCDLIAYLESIEGVPRINPGINPATWMLEMTSPAVEERLGIDFAACYAKSDLARQCLSVVEESSLPLEGSRPLEFANTYPLTFAAQFRAIFHKFMLTNWRDTPLNSTRFALTIGVGFVFGTIFWRYGQKTNNQMHLINAVGSLYSTTLFLGIVNSLGVQPMVATERSVYYREHAAGYYSVFPFYFAMAAVQCIYILVQSVIYVCIVYWCIWWAADAGKFFYFLLFLFLTLLYFAFYGIMAVFVTPNLQIAAVLFAFINVIFNLFAGFVIPRPSMPGWWVWAYYINPVAWSIYGLVVSQYGNDTTEIVRLSDGTRMSVSEYYREDFGFKYEMIGFCVLILCGFTVFFWVMGALGLRFCKFLKR